MLPNRTHKHFLVFLFALLFITFGAHAKTATPLNDLIEALLQNNPELKSLVNQVNAANNYVSQSAWIDDPQVGIEASNIPVENASLKRSPMTSIQIYLKQKIPFPTKLVTKHHIAKSKSNQTMQAYLEKINHLVSEFKITYYDYSYTVNAIQINSKNKRRLIALTNILESRYATGTTPQQDVLKTKLEVSHIEDKLIQLNKMKQIELARLNTLLLRPQDTPITADNAHLPKITNHKLTDLLDLAKNNRPWLNLATAQINEAKQNKKLSHQELLPNFDFSVGYRFRNDVPGDPVSGEDFLSTGVSLNMPFLWTTPKHIKNISENKQKILAAQNYKLAIEQEIVYQVSKSYHELKNLKEQLSLYHSKLLPESTTTLNASLSSYETGQSDYMNLITSELTLFRHELDYLKYRYDYAKAFVELEKAIGKPF